MHPFQSQIEQFISTLSDEQKMSFNDILKFFNEELKKTNEFNAELAGYYKETSKKYIDMANRYSELKLMTSRPYSSAIH
ncbi:hypothetical protein [uncultured Photobacterium sp.]|uniref:hypothetical protein n=1 Tax=uncultured Photobacterium sp. TaxID=173973 RepID=UPI00260DC134|nr:hypothetical protein [uncultured Photobacterium sp.]